MRALAIVLTAAGLFAFAGLEAFAQSGGSGASASKSRTVIVKKKRVCKSGYYLTKSNKCLLIKKKTVRRSAPKGSH